MIVPMKKAAVVTQAKDAPAALESLRSLGILHLELGSTLPAKTITDIENDIGLVSQAAEILSKEKIEQRHSNEVLKEWRVAVSHIVELNKRLGHLEEFSRNLKNKISQWEKWGDFEPEKIPALAQKNIYISLYQIPVRDMKSPHFPPLPRHNVGVLKKGGLWGDLVAQTLFISCGIAHCVVVSRGKVDIGFKEIPLPQMGLEKMRLRLKEDMQTIKVIRQQLARYRDYYTSFIDVRDSLRKELEFQTALNSMEQIGELKYLSGYIPYDKVKQIMETAKREKWGLLLTEPSRQDNVPVLLRNSRWVSLLEPVFKLLEVIPGYHELDVSPLFLLFLSLFFGMIIGDAGYGAVYFLLTFISQRKFSSRVKDKNVFFLFYWFSFCAIIWGLLTGTVFGQQWYLAKGFKAFVPLLNQTKFLMAFCFFVGGIQLSLAHCWQAIRKFPSLNALADIGFICLLWAGFFLAKMFILADPFPFFGRWLIWAGVLLIIFFSNPQKNIFKAVLKGTGVLLLGIMGNFGDVVSYIRLFAMGLAGVAVADSVNSLASAMGNNIVIQLIVLFIGHTINIVLGPLSVLVHGIRLNLLEFSLLHGNVTWSGVAYKPLKS